MAQINDNTIRRSKTHSDRLHKNELTIDCYRHKTMVSLSSDKRIGLYLYRLKLLHFNFEGIPYQKLLSIKLKFFFVSIKQDNMAKNIVGSYVLTFHIT